MEAEDEGHQGEEEGTDILDVRPHDLALNIWHEDKHKEQFCSIATEFWMMRLLE